MRQLFLKHLLPFEDFLNGTNRAASEVVKSTGDPQPGASDAAATNPTSNGSDMASPQRRLPRGNSSKRDFKAIATTSAAAPDSKSDPLDTSGASAGPSSATPVEHNEDEPDASPANGSSQDRADTAQMDVDIEAENEALMAAQTICGLQGQPPMKKKRVAKPKVSGLS